jgi:hypothetical protein
VRSDRERLHDITEAIERIEKYVVQGRAALEMEPYLEAPGGWANSFGTCARKVFGIE